MRASTQLNALADVRPEITVLRSELAHCYLNSATILEGMGQMGDARETRVLAVNELQTLLKAKPKDFTLRLLLASTYASMAETSMLAGDVSSADQLSQNSTKLLEQLQREQPENSLVATRPPPNASSPPASSKTVARPSRHAKSWKAASSC